MVRIFCHIPMAAEAVSPLPSTAPRQQRAPIANRLQSPTTPFFLGSNNDQLELAQARAARAAAIRCKAATTADPPPPSTTGPGLSKDQIVELFHNCIKLASENKINQKNTWQLKLIDHLSEIIKVEAENDSETNFQKASCTLEAGVKIYSVRVDAVHSEAYKVLSTIYQVALEDEQENIAEVDYINGKQGKCHSKSESIKILPLSTLESCFEALNVKKFDVAFAVDPLYHRTSSLFDEGGARGLLLNNLGVYGGCCVLFDSFEVPGKYKSYPNQIDTSDMIDLSFTKESIEQMVTNMATMTELSPTLRDIVCLLDEHSQRLLPTVNLSEESEPKSDGFGDEEPDLDGNFFGNFDTSNFGHCDETSDVNERSSFVDPAFHGNHEENDTYTFYEPNMDDVEKILMFLFQGLGNTLKQNLWAGPDHWKYRRSKGLVDDPPSECGPNFTTRRSRNKRILDIDIEFMKSLDKKMPDILSPPKNPKSMLLPSNRTPLANKLPEDRHYHSLDLVRLFLLPDIMCLGKRRRKLSDENPWHQNVNIDESLLSRGSGSVLDCHYDDAYVHGDGEVSDGLVTQPRQVNKTEVHYDKTSKQVDVHALKETLWVHLQESNESTDLVTDDTISFRHLLATFPNNCPAAALDDISPHLCFICLLHLANEHGLCIDDCTSLDDLSICLPSRQNV